MKERPILFSAAMVQAILAGKKTQTRRVVKDQASASRLMPDRNPCPCPYGQPGDRLWVKETFYPLQAEDRCVPRFAAVEADYIYRADYDYREAERSVITATRKWKPSIFMPRAASRITLEVVTVRVEALNYISHADAIAEGVDDKKTFTIVGTGEKAEVNGLAPLYYAMLWDSINGPGSWNANPWVWVIEFKRVVE